MKHECEYEYKHEYVVYKLFFENNIFINLAELLTTDVSNLQT